MAFTYKIRETEYENLKDGEYLAQLKGIEEKMNEYGSYIQISEQLQGGRMRYQKFDVGSNDPKKQDRGHKDFSTFCSQLSGLSTGHDISDQGLLNKKYILTIKNIELKNGNMWEKAVKRTLVEAPPLEAMPQQQQPVAQNMQYGGIGIPQNPVTSNQPLNDEVPF